MPRPRKIKRLGQKPHYNEFGPKGVPNEGFVYLNLDEYETIKLIDKEFKNQEDCAISMGIARSTVQKIYSDARTKIANAIVNGDTLIIEGNDYSN
jgi:predicted DNA-binding protein (UPF0251 family)